MDNTATAPQKPHNGSTARPEPIPVKAEYFECPEGEPSVLTLLIGLHGVCGALEAEQVSFSDDDQIERMEGLGVAAAVLARQLYHRYYANSKPPTKRQIEKARKHQSDWARVMEQAQQAKLAGPAEGTA